MPVWPHFDRDDRHNLFVFVAWVRDFLGEIVSGAKSDLFYARLIKPMQAAWEEVQGEFDSVLEGVRGLSTERMDRHGLRGAQLRFKLATIEHILDLFRRYRTGRILRKLLNSINTLLDSILSAIPGGTAVSEIKDTIRDALKTEAEP